MSLVTVHGPNTMYTGTPGVGGSGAGQTIQSVPPGATAVQRPTNGLIFDFAVNSTRAAGDFGWTFTGQGGNPAAQPGAGKGGSVTFNAAGAGTIVMTVAAGAGTPAAGTYTISVTASAGTPRSLPHDAPQAQQQSAPEVDVGYDPAAHTVDEVIEFAEEHPEQITDIYAAEAAGKNRSTLLSHLEHMQQ